MYEVKSKVVPVLNYAMKAQVGVDVWIHIFLTSALAGGEWSASCPGRFTLGTHWIEGLGGPQRRSGQFGEEKILDLTGNRIPEPSVVQPVTSHYTDYATLAPYNV
jgi:hypothetical protein